MCCCLHLGHFGILTRDSNSERSDFTNLTVYHQLISTGKAEMEIQFMLM